MSNNSGNYFFSNLEFFKKCICVNQENFCVAKNCPDGIIPISSSAYDTYRNGKIPRPDTMRLIVDALNIQIGKDAVLQKRFPNGILAWELVEVDLSDPKHQGSYHVHEFHSHKFVGTYMCYYMSTRIEGKKFLQYGVVQLFKGDTDTEFNAYGVFSLKDYNVALDLFEKAKITTDSAVELKSIVEGCGSKFMLFSGNAILSTSLLWCTLSNEKNTEHVTVSFDLNEKIVTMNGDKDFIGARGIALSQTTGQGFKTVTFPMVFIKHPLYVSAKELSYYLNFNYSQMNDNELTIAAKKAAHLFESFPKEVYSVGDLTDFVATLLKKELTRILKESTFNSHYYLTEEVDDFYSTIINPIRKKIEDETE